MKAFVVILICVIHSTIGGEVSLDEAIQEGKIEISAVVLSWFENIQKLKPAEEEAHKQITEEFGNISAALITKPAHERAFANYKQAYHKFVASVRNTIDLIGSKGLSILEKGFRPETLPRNVYKHISDQISGVGVQASGNSCKENLFNQLKNSSIENVEEYTSCVFKALNEIETEMFQGDVSYLTKFIIPTYAKDTIDQLKLCAEGEDANCFDRMTNKTTVQAKAAEDYKQKFFEEFIEAITKSQDGFNACIKPVIEQFDLKVREAEKAIKNC